MSGQLLFQRSGALYGATFNPASARIVGTSVKLSDEPRQQPTGGLAADVSPTGDLLLADTRTFDGRLTWVGFDGTERPIAVPPARLQQSARVSRRPHRRLLGRVRDLVRRHGARVADPRVRRERRCLPVIRSGRLTARTSTSARQPASSACAPTAGAAGRFRDDADRLPERGDGRRRRLLDHADQRTTERRRRPASAQGRRRRVLVSTPAYEGGPQLSPDGKWITYSSNMSGRMEVYLRPVDGPERYPVSTRAAWARCGAATASASCSAASTSSSRSTSRRRPQVALSPPKVLFDPLRVRSQCHHPQLQPEP